MGIPENNLQVICPILVSLDSICRRKAAHRWVPRRGHLRGYVAWVWARVARTRAGAGAELKFGLSVVGRVGPGNNLEVIYPILRLVALHHG